LRDAPLGIIKSKQKGDSNVKQKFLFVCLLLAVLASAADAQACFPFPMCSYFPHGTIPLVVQSGFCPNGGTSSCTITLGSAVAATHRVLIYVVSNGSGSTAAMTGESVTTIAGASNNSGFQANAFAIQSAVGGQTAISCGGISASVMGCGAIELSDPQNLSSPIDASGNAHATSPSGLTVSTSAANTVASDAVVGFFAAGGGSAFTVGSGFTYSAQTPTTYAFQMLIEVSWPGTTAVQTATATGPTGTTNIPEGVVAVKP
jgi:hypothetical protein